MGIGAGLIFAPASSVVTLHFQNRPRRHLAYGIALSGISFGALIFPIGEHNKIRDADAVNRLNSSTNLNLVLK